MALRIASFIAIVSVVVFLATNPNRDIWEGSLATQVLVAKLMLYLALMTAIAYGLNNERIPIWLCVVGWIGFFLHWYITWPELRQNFGNIILATSEVAVFTTHTIKGWRGFLFFPHG